MVGNIHEFPFWGPNKNCRFSDENVENVENVSFNIGWDLPNGPLQYRGHYISNPHNAVFFGETPKNYQQHFLKLFDPPYKKIGPI